ncbi:hypothetical protein EOM09_06470 [bacterium]|nr:hypothetical protein [bacterium]
MDSLDKRVKEVIKTNYKIRFPTPEQIQNIKNAALEIGLSCLQCPVDGEIKSDKNSKFQFKFRRVK